MEKIIVFGAGRSSLFLIEYLDKYCLEHQMGLTVCDRDISYAQLHLANLSSVVYVELDIADDKRIHNLIQEVVLVVSLLPANLHIHIAKICVELGVHMATASYVSDEMKSLDVITKSKGLIFLNEIGLDPGIDHMSAMQMMHGIQEKGGVIKGFESYCGGLVADEDDGNNPWKYKFSWNPRNVVLAAQGTPAFYLENKAYKLKPYHKVFDGVVDFDIPDYGALEAYPNRDSLKYIDLYGLQGVDQMIRGTFRKPGFCKAWQVLVELGMTDDQHVLDLPDGCSKRQWLLSYLPSVSVSVKETIKSYCHCSEVEINKLDFLGLFSEEALPLTKGSSAQILEEILKIKWRLQSNDKDLVVMLHKITYELNGIHKTHTASMVIKGESNIRTAMAKTVGLPLAIGCQLILEKKILQRGVITPVTRDIYEPVLLELKSYGIGFLEEEN